MICLKVIPVPGSGRSKARFVVNSLLFMYPSLEERAAWRATKDAYLPLLEKESMDWKGGTSLILVPSGKSLAAEPYHLIASDVALKFSPRRIRDE